MLGKERQRRPDAIALRDEALQKVYFGGHRIAGNERTPRGFLGCIHFAPSNFGFSARSAQRLLRVFKGFLGSTEALGRGVVCLLGFPGAFNQSSQFIRDSFLLLLSHCPPITEPVQRRTCVGVGFCLLHRPLSSVRKNHARRLRLFRSSVARGACCYLGGFGDSVSLLGLYKMPLNSLLFTLEFGTARGVCLGFAAEAFQRALIGGAALLANTDFRFQATHRIHVSVQICLARAQFLFTSHEGSSLGFQIGLSGCHLRRKPLCLCANVARFVVECAVLLAKPLEIPHCQRQFQCLEAF